MIISLGFIWLHFKSSLFHYSGDTYVVHTTIVDFLIVHAVAVIPVKVLPAPHGKTIIPDLALPLLNILLNAY